MRSSHVFLTIRTAAILRNTFRSLRRIQRQLRPRQDQKHHSVWLSLMSQMVDQLEEVLWMGVSSGIQRRTVEQHAGLLAPAFPERISARTEVIEVPKISWSSWPGADDTASADVTTVAKTVGESRPPPGIAKHSTTTEMSSGEAGPSWSTANDLNSAADTAAVTLSQSTRKTKMKKKHQINIQTRRVWNPTHEWNTDHFAATQGRSTDGLSLCFRELILFFRLCRVTDRFTLRRK